MRKPSKQKQIESKEEQISMFVDGADGGVHETAIPTKPKNKAVKPPIGLTEKQSRNTVQIRINDETQQRIYNIRQNIKKHGIRWNLSNALTVALEAEISAMETEIERRERLKK